jgi:hypothetical protein
MNKFNHLYKQIINEKWQAPEDFENSPLPQLKKVLQLLNTVKGPQDLRKIKLNVLWTGSDDTGGREDEYGNEIENCANVTINGVQFAFWWMDDLSFLFHWKEDEQAFADLITAVENVIEVESNIN